MAHADPLLRGELERGVVEGLLPFEIRLGADVGALLDRDHGLLRLVEEEDVTELPLAELTNRRDVGGGRHDRLVDLQLAHPFG
ncbi:hypothetical protein ACFPRL_14075 [Pseudoclavibacter helvolus]